MKKINLLTIPALVAVLPATMTLTQCAKSDNREPSVEGEVNITTTKNTDGSISCSLSPKSNRQKITTIAIKIGTTTLVEGTDYETNLNSTNADAVNAKIYKSALDKYQGDIVITPVLDDKQFNGIIVELTQKTFYLHQTLWPGNINVFQSLEGTKGEPISWDDEKLKIKDEIGEFTSVFKTYGYTFGTCGDYNFTIYYDSFCKDISFNITELMRTITFTTDAAECLTVETKTVKIADRKKWSEVEKPTIQGKDDATYDETYLSHMWINASTGLEMQDNDEISSDLTVKLVSTNKSEPSSKVTHPDTYYVEEGYGKPYWHVNYDFTDGSGHTQAKQISAFSNHEFSYTLAQNDTVRYFFVGKKEDSSCSYLYKNNFVSFAVDGNQLEYGKNYSFVNWGNKGQYLALDETITGGSTITLTFRPLTNFDSAVIVFQAA